MQSLLQIAKIQKLWKEEPCVTPRRYEEYNSLEILEEEYFHSSLSPSSPFHKVWDDTKKSLVFFPVRGKSVVHGNLSLEA